MSLEAIKYNNGKLEILDQLLLPVQSKYLSVKNVEDGWKVINKMQVSFFHCLNIFCAHFYKLIILKYLFLA